jgi:protein O-mannosyl-transferase
MLKKVDISSENKKYICPIIVFLIVASCAAFCPILDNDFINYDDNMYIIENNHIKSGINPESVKWAFKTSIMGNWHPVTWLSHMLDWGLFGANASGHHLVSLLLHIGTVLFLFLFLNKTTKNIWPSAFAAAFFALHPLRVESVAWAAERKDVLSMFFGLACLYAYAFYAELPKLSKYISCLILFALSLMSKPMTVTLPFVLILLDYWPLKRWQKVMDKQSKGFNSSAGLIFDKVPFILLTIFLSIETFLGQNRDGAVSELIPFLSRVANAAVSYVAYLVKIFWPVNLAIFYPYDFYLSLWKVLISGIILILITIAVLCYIRKRPFLFVGWFLYLGTLIPVIGLVQVGAQSMADRYTYLPSVGIAIMLAWGIQFLDRSENIRKGLLFTVAIAVLATMMFLTWMQCRYWKNSIELWNHALKVTDESYLPYYNLGCAFQEKGKNNEAIENFKKALQFSPDKPSIHVNLGTALLNNGDIISAAEEFRQTIRLSPNHAGAHNNLAMILYNQKQYGSSRDHFQQAVSLQPNFANAHYHLALIFARERLYEKAFSHYNNAVRINPVYGTGKYRSDFLQLTK